MKFVDEVREVYKQKLPSYEQHLLAETSKLLEDVKKAILQIASCTTKQTKTVSLRQYVCLSNYPAECVSNVASILRNEGFNVNALDLPNNIIVSWE